MRFQIPGTDIKTRLFERVETVDPQYDVFDIGVEQEDGSIDSLVVGGSFSFAKSLISDANKRRDEKKAEAAATEAAPAS